MTDREREILCWIEENPMISQQELALRAGITRSSVAVHISNLMKKGYIRGKGYVLQTSPYVVVAGGANTDIFGRPSAPLVPQDSNPGRVRMSLGGVGRNIAHNLRLLGEDVSLITAFGGDLHAEELGRSCRELGIDVADSLTVPEAATSTYLFITDEAGEMQLAVSDMEIYERMTPAFFEQKLDRINGARLAVLDANLPEESLRFLAENCKCPLFADTVSTKKALKLRGILGRLDTIKPNRIEAELLTGVAIRDEASLREAANRFLRLGVRRVFLSLGADGVYCADERGAARLPCYPSRMVNSTGAGDSFMAALAWARLRGFSLEDSARAGLAAASVCIASLETISAEISPARILELMGAPSA